MSRWFAAHFYSLRSSATGAQVKTILFFMLLMLLFLLLMMILFSWLSLVSFIFSSFSFLLSFPSNIHLLTSIYALFFIIYIYINIYSRSFLVDVERSLFNIPFLESIFRAFSLFEQDWVRDELVSIYLASGI